MLAAVVLLSGSPVGDAHADVELSPDAEFQVIAERVPGFGGAWVEGDATRGDAIVHLWLVEPTAEAERQARELLVELFGERFDQETVVVHRADLPWDQLQTWYVAASEALGVPGIVFTDNDERINRIVVGVEDPERHEPAVREVLDELAIPQSAVVVQQSEPIRLLIDRSGWPAWANWAAGRFLAGLVVGFVVGFAVAVVIARNRRRAGGRSRSGDDVEAT